MTVQNGAEPVVWLVAHHPLANDYLMSVIERDPSITVRRIGDKIPPEEELGENPVLVLDNASLETSAQDYMRRLNQRLNDVRYIVLDKELEVYKVCQLMCLGSHGFLTYSQVEDSLALAIRAVQSGGTWMDSRVLQRHMRLRKSERDDITSGPAKQSLTIREEDILQLARQRLSNKEVAALLNIEVSTVKFHLTNIFSKLHIKSRTDLWQSARLGRVPEGLHSPMSLPINSPAPQALRGGL